MTTLTDIQHAVLSAACQRPNRLVLPLPERLRGGAAQKVAAALIAKGLVEEVGAGVGDPLWRETGDGHGVTLSATDAALEALGIGSDEPAADRTPAPVEEGAQDSATPRRRQRAPQRHGGARFARGRSRRSSSPC
jgi:hypothetical protein